MIETKPDAQDVVSIADRHREELMAIAEYLEQKGLKKGIEKGEGEAALKIARTMLANGFEHAMVIQLTGLSVDDLAQVRHCPFGNGWLSIHPGTG